ncbi:MAG: hypothetical protein AAGD14_01390 [Planctomycetota bacterium]
MDVVTGLVFDELGAPVPHARILFDRHQESPVELSADHTGRFRIYDPEQLRQIRGPDRTIHAELDDRCSLAVRRSIYEGGGEIVVPDLVLQPARFAEVQLRWTDGLPAEGVPVMLFLTQDEPNGEGGPSRSLIAVTDADGRCRLGPMPRARLGGILHVFAPHAASHREFFQWPNGPRDFGIQLRRARVVRGSLVTAEGAPATGHRVAIHDDSYGSPDADMTATVDGNGCFELGDVPQRNAVLGIYAPPSSARSDDPIEQLRQSIAATGSPCDPIDSWSLPDEVEEIGTFQVERTGTLVIRLRDASSALPIDGSVMWMRQDLQEASRGHFADERGEVRIEHVPRDVPLRLEAKVRTLSHGELFETRVLAALPDEPLDWIIGGEGTIIVRLWQNGERVMVSHIEASWSGG